MALTSPGVEVTVTDESAYAAATASTVPLIFICTAQDKYVPSSTSTIAEGTLKANANKAYLMTSQSDALQYFGTPIFQEDDGTVLQGDELNEWGLHSLYSTLGVTSQAWAVRADIDLQELSPTQVEPRNAPLGQTVWLDTDSSTWGLRKYSGTSWVLQEVLVPTTAQLDGTDADKPAASFGTVINDTLYAVVPYNADGDTESTAIVRSTNTIWQKGPSDSEWQPTTLTYSSVNAPSSPSADDLWVKTDSPSNGMNLSVKTYQSSTSSWVASTCYAGTSFLDIEARFGASLSIGDKGFRAYEVDGTTLDGNIYNRTGSTALTITIPVSGLTVADDIQFLYTDNSLPFIQTSSHVFSTEGALVTFINGLSGLTASTDGTDITVRSALGRSFKYVNTGSTPLVLNTATSNWAKLNYFAQEEAPSLVAAEGSLWFSDELYFDFMVNRASGGGPKWEGLSSTAGGYDRTYMINQSQPDTRDDATALQAGDIWVDPADGANFVFYVYKSGSWVLLDQTDQSTTEGILFTDMRQADENGIGYITESSNSIAKDALLVSDHVDPDCPDPRLYPQGMIACNIRGGSNIVRTYVADPFSEYDIDGSDEYFVGGEAFTLAPSVNDAGTRGRWVTESGIALDGSGVFGRKAQRKVIVEALAAATLTEEIRSEFMEFNLMVAPGYVELLDELVTLNTDRKETAYIITDVPARLAPTGTEINNWSKNANNAPSNGEEGRLTAYAYSAQYMGWCLGTNVDGSEVAIPGSSVALRTYVYSDSVSYVWYPPAGAQRGVVTNAASTGYINDEGEYTPVIYNQGQRDVMYANNINPIAMRPSRGLLVYGDKSLSADASALDRVNVGRLVVYIRTQVAKIAERYLFQLNTASTREALAGSLNAFLSNIVQLDGLTDFVVVCDSSNNTATRINNNQLWAEIAIQPTKSVNFILIPIRIQNAS